ncbi:MAG: cytochrome c oxidase accessory protein CcoG, partial [Notoacmeibacter sp.]
IIAVATGGAWIFYFADAPTLLSNLVTLNAPVIAYATVAVLTATTYVFGGLMREQVCIYMCPWPRIQAAMLDEDSLVVTYNDWRGEPRSHGTKKAAALGQSVGDCVDCNACVVVCPMGIDIRDGQQMECITCALCIDACDGVMEKIGKPKGLISYSTLSDYNFNMALASPAPGTIDPARVRNEAGAFIPAIKQFSPKVILRPRTFIYSAAWLLIGAVLIYALLNRSELELNVQHDRNPVAVKLSNGSVRNGYTVKVLNKALEPRTIEITVDNLAGAKIAIEGVTNIDGLTASFEVEPNKLRALRFYISVSPEVLPAMAKAGQTPFTITAKDWQSLENDTYDAVFEVPEAMR